MRCSGIRAVINRLAYRAIQSGAVTLLFALIALILYLNDNDSNGAPSESALAKPLADQYLLDQLRKS